MENASGFITQLITQLKWTWHNLLNTISLYLIFRRNADGVELKRDSESNCDSFDSFWDRVHVVFICGEPWTIKFANHLYLTENLQFGLSFSIACTTKRWRVMCFKNWKNKGMPRMCPFFAASRPCALYALKICRWPPTSELVCGLAFARAQRALRTFSLKRSS